MSHVEAAVAALALAFLVGCLGVPYAHNPQDQVGLLLALGLLALGPICWPMLGLRARLGIGLAVVGAFTEPVVRAEYLTWRHGQALRDALVGEHPEARNQKIFSVLSYSHERARVLHVASDGEGALLRFETDGKGLWHVAPGSYPPQQLLWYYGNSGQYDCPYPTSVLLLVHSRGIWCG